MLRLAASQARIHCIRSRTHATSLVAGGAHLVWRQSFSTSKHRLSQNRVYAPIRNQDEFNTAISLSSSSGRTLVTLWTTSWSDSCKVIGPLVTSLVNERVGEDEAKDSSLAYAEIEFDSPNISSVAERYVVTSVPTLVSFRDGNMQEGSSRVTDESQLKDESFLRAWLEDEARRGSSGGSGGGSIFAGLFGSWFGGR